MATALDGPAPHNTRHATTDNSKRHLPLPSVKLGDSQHTKAAPPGQRERFRFLWQLRFRLAGDGRPPD